MFYHKDGLLNYVDAANINAVEAIKKLIKDECYRDEKARFQLYPETAQDRFGDGMRH